MGKDNKTDSGASKKGKNKGRKKEGGKSQQRTAYFFTQGPIADTENNDQQRGTLSDLSQIKSE
jgi:hypothetical protein